MRVCVCLLGRAVSSEINKAQAQDLRFVRGDRQVNSCIYDEGVSAGGVGMA